MSVSQTAYRVRIEDLYRDPFIRVPRLGSNLVTLVVEAWGKFCELPQEVKAKFGLEAFNTKYSDPGYWRKDRTDRKELFHLPVGIIQWLYNQGKYLDYFENPVVKEFIDLGMALHGALIHHLGQHIMFPGDQMEFPRWLELSMVRFLRYDVKDPGDEVADPHFDFSWATCHIHASHPRLQVRADDEWIDVNTADPDWMPFFSGYQMYEWTQGAQAPRVHRVLQEAEGTRTSIVLFIPSPICERFPKGEDQLEWCQERGLDWFNVDA